MDEPNITLPLATFLEILWGYKKGAELRERAIPDTIVVECIRRIPNYNEYVFIQDATKPGELATVWQRNEWRNAGEKQEALRIAMEKLWASIDFIRDALFTKFGGVLDKNICRQMASDYITNKDWVNLEALGVDTSNLK